MGAVGAWGSPSGGLTWAAIGHRPHKLGGYGDDVFRNLVGLAVSFIEHFKPSRMISGMALGWDMAVATACVQMKIPFIAALPFEGQENRWPELSKIKYKELLALADNIHVVSLFEFTNIAHVMHTRNRWMVDHCDKLVSLWDGQESGGTFQCVKYAESVRKPIINLWNDFMV